MVSKIYKQHYRFNIPRKQLKNKPSFNKDFEAWFMAIILLLGWTAIVGLLYLIKN